MMKSLSRALLLAGVCFELVFPNAGTFLVGYGVTISDGSLRFSTGFSEPAPVLFLKHKNKPVAARCKSLA